MSEKFGKLQNVFSAQGGDGAGTAMNVDAFDELIVQIGTVDNADATMKHYGSVSATEPTWGSAASDTNMYTGVRLINLNDNSSVIGETGEAFGGVDVVKHYKINVSGMRWYNAIISSFVAGKMTVNVKAYKKDR